MPVLVGLIIRSTIQMAITLGIISVAEKYILPLINRAIQEIMELFGVSEETAQDVMANEMLQFAENVGIGVVTLRAKLPTVIAEKLGFTTKGFNVRKSAQIDKVKAASGAVPKALTTAVITVPTAAEAVNIVTNAKTKVAGFGSAMKFLEGRLNTVFLGFIVFVNLVDFGNWNSGAYQKTFQRIFEFLSFGLLKPDQDWRTAKTASPEVFDKVYNTYKLEGATAIHDPYKGASVLFTRNNLLDIIDRVGAELLRTTQKASTKDVILATQLMISIPVSPPGGAPSLTSAAGAAVAVAATPGVPQVKVLTGIVKSGTLGEPQEFVAREADLIENTSDLISAFQNNLAAFITTLPNKLKYELKMAPSVLTKDGTRRIGTAQQIIKGYSKSGKPQFRTVTNKFAVLDIFIFTARNVRSKIDSLVLGPVDAVKVQPATNELARISTEVKDNIEVKKISEISSIATAAPITITTPQPPAPPPEPTQVVIPGMATPTAGAAPGILAAGSIPVHYFLWWPAAGSYYIDGIIRGSAPDRATAFANANTSTPGIIDLGDSAAPAGGAGRPQADADFSTAKIAIAPPAPPVVSVLIPPSNNPNKCSAQSIAEYFDINRVNYPSVTDRGKLYEAFGLGPALWYSGTFEQNTKLLNEIKRRQGCLV